jgi:hypothetical protein
MLIPVPLRPRFMLSPNLATQMSILTRRLDNVLKKHVKLTALLRWVLHRPILAVSAARVPVA